jgi:hypothetical protein
MSVFRALVCLASIFLGLASASAQVQGTVAPGQVQGTSTVAPPLFQGIMVDAKGKTVGRLASFPILGASRPYPYAPYVVRQINGIWVTLRVDLETGLALDNSVAYLYQSADCTGQAYLSLSLLYTDSPTPIAPEIGTTAIVPPETIPSIYFADKPVSVLNIKSAIGGIFGTSCQGFGGFIAAVGLPQSVPVSSLGLTPPFTVK